MVFSFERNPDIQMAPNLAKNRKTVMASYVVYMTSFLDFFDVSRFLLSRVVTGPSFKSM